MTTMVTLGLVLFGLMAYQKLPISDLPSIAYPIITVKASDPGLDPEAMANNVATPLEQQFMTITGLKNIISSSRYSTTVIVLEFNPNKDLNVAATDTASAINNASGNLPSELPSPPSYRKTNPADAPIMYIAVTSETMTQGELYDYSNTIISQRISMIEGVSEVAVYGSKSNVRVKLNPEKLAAMNIGIDEVADAVVDANQKLPAGKVYDDTNSYLLLPQGQVESAEQYDNIIIAKRDGKPIYLKDVGKAINSIHDEYHFFNFWKRGKGEAPTVSIGITKQPGANTVELCREIRNLLPILQQQLPPSINLDPIFDRSILINASINDVLLTLFIAFVLVVLVIFLFLGKVSSTIIPSISLPVTIFGTFTFMYFNNYNIDILSMLGLTLVIGFLVDDAIVVLENIVRHLDMGKTPYQAALDGSKQISTTVLSMTLSLSAVFIPLIFMPGMIGRMFHEMAMVVVISVLLSGTISLMLTPMLCSKFLRQTKTKSWLEIRADRLLQKLLNLYEPALTWLMKKRYVPICLGISTLCAAYFLFQIIPMDFLPPGDTGGIEGVTIAAQNISFESMKKHQEEVISAIKENPYVDNLISMANTPGYIPSNEGFVFISLIDIDKRPHIEVVRNQLEAKVKDIVGVQTFLKLIPQINLNINTGAERAAYTYVLSGMGDPKALYDKTGELATELKKLPELADVSTNIENASPQVKINILRDQASTYGISAKTIENALNLGFSGARVSTFQTPLNTYDIVLELENSYKKSPDSLEFIRLSSDNGNLIPLKAVAEWEETVGPLQVDHHNQLPAASIYFNVAPGVALSTALQKVSDKADEILSPQITRTFQGQAAVFKGTIKEMGPLLLIGILAIYLLLGSLYENFFHPLTILSTLPGAIFGALVTLLIFSATLSLYAYVGMIVLIGIVLKNSIMLVEFANEQALEGKEITEAIIEACKVRFRPILMTTVAAAMGAIPIVIGIGADAASRRSMGLVILGGLLFAQLITYFFTPVVCYYSMRLQKKHLKH